jgi:uncharacterized protein
MIIIKRMLSMGATDLKFDADKGTFKGYASVWDGVDSYMDTIRKGAYVETLKKYGLPKMFYNHQHDLPVGKYTNAEETAKGLWIEGEITPGISRASDMRAAMKHETLDGLSVGGYVEKDGYTIADKGIRVIHKWHYLMEVSPVVFPADDSAKIDLATVKSMDFEALLPECKTERDIERLLRDAGLGKWEAMAIVSRAREIFKGRDAPEDHQQTTHALILARLANITKLKEQNV